jgi:N-acetylglutamate synthase-like GNAT family acetyltransferase
MRYRIRSAVGFAAILPREDRNTELDAMFVEPCAWRREMGQFLVEHCKNVARASGSKALHVIGNPHAEQFYMACGFRKYGTAATRFGVGQLLRVIL